MWVKRVKCAVQKSISTTLTLDVYFWELPLVQMRWTTDIGPVVVLKEFWVWRDDGKFSIPNVSSEYERLREKYITKDGENLVGVVFGSMFQMEETLGKLIRESINLSNEKDNPPKNENLIEADIPGVEKPKEEPKVKIPLPAAIAGRNEIDLAIIALGGQPDAVLSDAEALHMLTDMLMSEMEVAGLDTVQGSFPTNYRVFREYRDGPEDVVQEVEEAEEEKEKVA